MLEAEVLVVNRLGLHARAAAKLVKAAQKFRSEIALCSVGFPEIANAKSIFTVLLLAAAKGDRVLVSVEGPDEKAAIETIVDLFETGFGEE